jgi:HPt (histidine-containing phosphotransfer) domain-containing protein
VLDVSGLIENLGDEEIAREIATLHLANSPSLLEKIRAAVARGDARMLQEGAHALKGMVGNFESGEAHQSAWRLELLGKDGNLALAAAELEALEAALESLNRGLREFVASGDRAQG